MVLIKTLPFIFILLSSCITTDYVEMSCPDLEKELSTHLMDNVDKDSYSSCEQDSDCVANYSYGCGIAINRESETILNSHEFKQDEKAIRDAMWSNKCENAVFDCVSVDLAKCINLKCEVVEDKEPIEEL